MHLVFDVRRSVEDAAGGEYEPGAAPGMLGATDGRRRQHFLYIEGGHL